MRIHIHLLLISLTLGNVLTAQTDPVAVKDNFDIYLMIGQSNMAGRGDIGEADEVVLESTYLFNGTDWEKAVAPMNKYSTVRKDLSYQKMNPSYTFGRKVASYTGRAIGLVVNARGGTSVGQWQKGYDGPDDFDLYEEAVKQLSKARKDGVFKGIIWHQGESDQSSSSTYMAKLKQLVKDLRMDLNKNVFFVAGEIGQWREQSEPMNRVIRGIANDIDKAGYIKSDGLQPINDDFTNPHFDGFGQRILGELYADEILKDVYAMDPGVASFYSECDYQGYEARLKEGKYTLEDLEKRGIRDNDIGSLKLEEGYEALLFTDQMKGVSVLIDASKDCLSDTAVSDDVSYVVIGKTGTTENRAGVPK